MESQVKAYGMQLNDGGNASFFAVIGKSMAASSAEELIKKIQDALYGSRSGFAWTEEEKKLGQYFNLSI